MSNLGSFAELVKKAQEEKRLRELAEQQRKQETVAPLLSELFSTVAKAKVTKADEIKKVEPLLTEFQTILVDPEKSIRDKEDKNKKIVELVSSLEEKISEPVNVEEIIDAKLNKSKESIEKQFASLVTKLQGEISTLKKHIDSKHNRTVMGSSGSGEVRILRMDDVDKSNLQDGAVMVWDSTQGKFVFALPQTFITDEEMPFAKRIDFITDNELYKGEAPTGSSEFDPVWRIHKIVMNSESDLVETWASGDSLYDKVWNDRFTYTYS